jgi:lantibiotic modifying enzyme
MSVSSVPHRPLARTEVEPAIADIAQALMALMRAGGRPSIEIPPAATLFLAHLGRVSGDAKYRKAANEAAEICAEFIAEVPMQPYLYGGIAGMAWPLAHMERIGGVDDALDFESIDELLIDSVGDDVTPPYDLISGAVGLGTYFLERLPAPAAAEGLRRVIARLEATGERDEHGMRWFTIPELVPSTQRDSLPAGKYDLGLAHGIPGVIAFLALALLHGADRQPAEEMLRESVRWLVGLERPEGERGAYGVMVDPRAPRTPLRQRAAWCYGDPGIAMALLLAARALGDGGLLRGVHRTARRAAALAESERDAVVDTSLCHGSAGLGHLFGILGRALDDGQLRRYADGWHATTMEMRRPGEGVAGFYFARWHEGTPRIEPDASFLQGAPGVGLSLLSALDPDGDRSWDRLLLLS